MKQRISALLRSPAFAVVALQEKIWNGGLRLTEGIATRPGFVTLTQRARQMPVTEALCALLLPVLAFLPLKAAALLLVFSGEWLAGLLGLIAANVLGVGLLARIYAIVEPVLLRVPALAHARQDFLEWRKRASATRDTGIQEKPAQAG